MARVKAAELVDPSIRNDDCCLDIWINFSLCTYFLLRYVVVITYVSTPETKMGVKPSVCWCELRFVESQMPFTDSSCNVFQVFQVLWQDFFLNRQASRFCCLDGLSLHSW